MIDKRERGRETKRERERGGGGKRNEEIVSEGSDGVHEEVIE